MSISYGSLYAQRMGDRAPAVAQMARYLPFVATAHTDLPILDIGCGQGLLLEALDKAGIPNKGIDTCPVQAASAQAHGCRAQHIQNTRTWLAEQHAAGLRWRTIFMMDVLEHLPATEQLALLEQLYSELPTGSRLILKCPNPDSIVGMRMTYGDYTHHFTPTSDLLTNALTSLGFSSITVCDELPWGNPVQLNIRPSVSLNASVRTKGLRDNFYYLSQRLFRWLRRLQIASEIGIETARTLPLTPNYLCIAEK
jgi:SAM-dependent methyltransferase